MCVIVDLLSLEDDGHIAGVSFTWHVGLGRNRMNMITAGSFGRERWDTDFVKLHDGAKASKIGGIV